MTTAVSAHLVVLANENGGGFNVQPGQQQAGGKVETACSVITFQSALRTSIWWHEWTHQWVSWLDSRLCDFLVLPCQGLAQDILSDLVEDACLGLCFDVHRAVKQGYFFLDDTDQESMRDFGEQIFLFINRVDYFSHKHNSWYRHFLLGMHTISAEHDTMFTATGLLANEVTFATQ